MIVFLSSMILLLKFKGWDLIIAIFGLLFSLVLAGVPFNAISVDNNFKIL